jgi:hypothetical protein
LIAIELEKIKSTSDLLYWFNVTGKKWSKNTLKVLMK